MKTDDVKALEIELEILRKDRELCKQTILKALLFLCDGQTVDAEQCLSEWAMVELSKITAQIKC